MLRVESYDAAEPHYREALAIRRRISKGLPDPSTAINLGNLASLLEDKGNLAGAEAYYREALMMRRKLYPEGHPSVARTLNGLGHVLQAKGDAAGAEQCYQEALTIERRPDHPERAIYLRNLAAALLELGRPTEAEAMAREARRHLQGQTARFLEGRRFESVLGLP